MKEKNVIVDKSYDFAVRIVKLYSYLSKNKSEYVLSKQILKAGTSIGANVVEAQDAQSRNDFISKLNIALKECSETMYWLKLLNDTKYIDDKMFESLYCDCNEIHKMLTSIIVTTKNN